MRLIDADALQRVLLPITFAFEREYGSLGGAVSGCMKHIDNAPTVDAVEVVRCKDCIRRYDTDECPMCFLIEGKYYEYTNGNGFCDRGERKEGVTNG